MDLAGPPRQARFPCDGAVGRDPTGRHPPNHVVVSCVGRHRGTVLNEHKREIKRLVFCQSFNVKVIDFGLIISMSSEQE